MISKKMKYNDNDDSNTYTDLKNKLQNHIQMTAGKQRDIANRVQAFENLVKQQSASITVNNDGQSDTNPLNSMHQFKCWNNGMMRPTSATSSKLQTPRGS